ncbi:bifunctional diaminohydroxyphosphoribosylaminopyrimidine deaminase/5-amino-6-(5-phosphoribosylamino)uracil reductase RibD [Candidatus Bipolaricaulota bacterium]|nr:bifunctional diaminohydroxyphosphoribosylaminopyrimidine deaminase/5-amino-6-(5-phosphoribosylamino)uracil reductase RibD [Candidatus Bipolaricaulota bacterium]
MNPTNPTNSVDERYMRLALELARRGEGYTNPNPIVGAVVVKDGEIIGRGWHKRFGGPHAEVFALEEAGEEAAGATIYVTLEPCSHYGKTPPCADRIIAAGISRGVVARRGPNPLVSGRGIDKLRAAGIEVTEGVLKQEAQRANEIFFKFITTRIPFVLLKLAESIDGKIATRTGDSKWITGKEARTEVHRLRRRFAAVLVGATTAIRDDPLLTVRHVKGPNPVRIVLDGAGRIPLDLRMFHQEGRTIVATAAMPEEKEERLRAQAVEVWRLPGAEGKVDLRRLLGRLGEENLDSLLVEGGSETAAAFLEARLVDKVALFIAPIIIGGRNAVTAVGGSGVERVTAALRLKDVVIARFGDDLLVSGYPAGLSPDAGGGV